MRKGKRLGTLLLRLVLLVVLLVNVTVICLEVIKGPEALEDVPYALLAVEGGSMEPGYHDGDGILVWQVPFSKLQNGEVSVFVQDGELVTHEIVAIQDGVITAKGTANDIEDEPVTEANYRAKVICRIPGMGILQSLWESPVAVVVLIVLLALLIFGKDIFNRIYERFS